MCTSDVKKEVPRFENFIHIISDLHLLEYSLIEMLCHQSLNVYLISPKIEPSDCNVLTFNDKCLFFQTGF